MSFEIPPNFILTPKQKNSSQSFINQSVLLCIPCCILSSKTVQSEEKNCPKFVRKKRENVTRSRIWDAKSKI